MTSENTELSIELQGWLFGMLGMLIFSLTLPMTRMAVESLSPYFVASGRAMLAALVGLPILLITSQPHPTRLQWKGLWLAGLGVIFGFPCTDDRGNAARSCISWGGCIRNTAPNNSNRQHYHPT